MGRYRGLEGGGERGSPLVGLSAADPAVWLGLTALLIGICLAVWLIPRWQAARWRRGGFSEEKIAEFVLDARTNLVQAVGGLALVATLALTAWQVSETRRSSERTLRLSEQGQLTERFARAVEELDAMNSPTQRAVDVRVGGLLSLLRLARDSPADALASYLVTAAYVSNNLLLGRQAPVPEPCNTKDPTAAGREKPSADVETALTHVLPELRAIVVADPTVEQRDASLGEADLSGLELTNVDFSNLDMERAHFANTDLRDGRFEGSALSNGDVRGACLERAVLQSARLDDVCAQQADLSFADLQSADLNLADLRGARLIRANLSQANLEGASLRGATLEGANLRDAKVTFADFRNVDLRDADISREELKAKGAIVTLKERDPIAGKLPVPLPDSNLECLR